MRLLAIFFTLFLILNSGVSQPSKQNPDFLNQGHQWADSILSDLSIDQKIGQLIMVDAYSSDTAVNREQVLTWIEEYEVGGVIFFAGTPHKQISLTNEYQKASHLPLMIALDAEYGASMRLSEQIEYPYNMTLGAIQDTELLYELGQEMGRNLKSLGVHVNFAPVVDVNNNPNNPIINWRSYGDDPQRVATLGRQVMLGMQSQGIIATAKHFPGHGDTDVDSHKDLPALSFGIDRMKEVELPPFQELINHGVGGVMVAHMEMPQLDTTSHLPTTLSGKVINDLLIKDMGFEGLVFTDALNMDGVTKYHDQRSMGVKALLAGNDVLLFPEEIDQMVAGIKEAINSKKLSIELINQKVRKVLLAKYWLGLSKDEKRIIREDWSFNHSAEWLQRRLIEKSITTLKNAQQVVPLKRLDTLRVASLSIGVESKSLFQDRLDDYMSIDDFQMSKMPTLEVLEQLRDQLDSYNLIIVGMHRGQWFPWSDETYDTAIYDWLAELGKRQKLLVVSFRSPYLISAFPVGEWNAFITTYQDGPLYQDYAAQLIFGGISSEGLLPISVDKEWKAGRGSQTGGDIRMKYTIPEELGIDGIELERRVDSVVYAGLDAEAYPGAQVLLAKDKKVFYHKAYGHHTYDKAREVKIDDIYDLASITKVTGATAGLMKLHDHGKFDLEARLKDYFPKMTFSNKKNVDFRNLLAHNARMKPWIAYYTTTTKPNGRYRSKTLVENYSEDYPHQLAPDLYMHKDYREKIYKMIKKAPMNKEGGYVYSGLAFYMFPDLISRQSGVDYAEFLDQTYYSPLGANTLTYNPLEKFTLDRIVPTEKDDYFRNMQLHGVVHDEGAAMMLGVSGNAGLFSNANDLAKMWQMYMDYGSYGGQEYISYQTIQKFTACQFCEQGNKRGLGFDKPDLVYDELGSGMAKNASPQTFGHSGYTGTLVWADPVENLMFIFLSNRVYPTRDNRKLYTMNIRPTIHNIVYDLLPKE